MIRSAAAEINNKVETFPALPATVTQVLAVTADPESSANDLMKVILPDQVMCSSILKVANSALFGIPREISTIERAIVVLGQDEIRNIVIGKAIFTSFPRVDREHRHSVGLFWEHAFTCGIAAKVIGEDLKLSPSELFIAGLIHDIGKLAIFLTFPNDYPILLELSSSHRFQSIKGEQSKYEVSHDKVGLNLAEKWLLPEKLAMAIGYHHSPLEAPHLNQYPLIIQVADILSLVHGSLNIEGGSDVVKIFDDFFPELADTWKKNELMLESDNLIQWFEKIKQQREDQQAILSILSS